MATQAVRISQPAALLLECEQGLALQASAWTTLLDHLNERSCFK
jgi:hypothetical protein